MVASTTPEKPVALPAVNASVIPFSRGDMAGKSAAAVKDAVEQSALIQPGSIRAKLYALQASVGSLPETECPLQHVFAPGAYARTIQIPAGTVIVGKIHKHQHLNILSEGEVMVLTESGGTEHLRGPLTMVSPPGTKRAVYALTNVVWTTVHVTELTDLDEIEDLVIAKSYQDYEQFVAIEKEKTMKQIEVQS